MHWMKHLLMLTTLLATCSVRAENWPQWRGPFFNGSTDETGLPENWSRTDNIAWSADLPGAAASTPIVWEDRVFLSGVDAARDQLQAMCLDRAQRPTAVAARRGGRHPQGRSQQFRLVVARHRRPAGGLLLRQRASWSASIWTATSLWTRNLQQDYGDIRLPVDVQQQSAAVRRQAVPPGLAARRAGGRPRPGGPRERILPVGPRTADRQDAVAARAPQPGGGRIAGGVHHADTVRQSGHEQLLIAGGDELTGHDPETGQELWRWGTWNPQRIPHWRLVPSPVAGDGVDAGLRPQTRSDLRPSQPAGRGAGRPAPGVGQPRCAGGLGRRADARLLRRGLLRAQRRARQLSRVEPRTGKVKWSVATPGRPSTKPRRWPRTAGST